MDKRFLVLGMDCLGAEILSPASLAELPNLERLAKTGLSGPLVSTLPPITIPAWTSMLSGRDPGELGVYGFRNRRSYAYGDLVYATSDMVRYPRLWDHVGEAGGESVVIGVPQTVPPPPIRGILISGFEAQGFGWDSGAAFARPPELADEMRDVAGGEYLFDVDNFRNVPRQEVLEKVYSMTECRFQLMEHLMKTRPWNFAMLCEIAPDRLHHCFWSDHDPQHVRHRSDSPYRNAIREYYRYLDGAIGRLVELAGPDTGLLVVSDHGAKAMDGGVCVNEVLRREGWLVLLEEPSKAAPLRPQQVDWNRTRAWGEGGYYARIFLNVEGREPQGVIPFAERDAARQELTELLESLPLADGPTLTNQIYWPEQIYRTTRGLAPDLIVIFNDLSWRSLGTVGHGRTWLRGNDTGVDEANHAQDGLFILHGPAVPAGSGRRASILDVTPTILEWLDLPIPGDLTGASLLG